MGSYFKKEESPNGEDCLVIELQAALAEVARLEDQKQTLMEALRKISHGPEEGSEWPAVKWVIFSWETAERALEKIEAEDAEKSNTTIQA